jgi:hypothetical protein
MTWAKWGALLLVVAGLPGCLGGMLGGLPSRDDIKVSTPSGVATPIPARVMLHVPKAELDRKLLVETHYFTQAKEGDIKDGEAMESAARTLLGQAFQTVSTNSPEIKPQLVVRPLGSARYSKYDGRIKLGCGLDLYDGGGARLGSFTARYDTDNTAGQANLETVYMLCLKKAADDMLASPAVVRLAKGGIADPAPAVSVAFLRSLGYSVK